MVPFDLWRESFLFAVIYAVMIIIPCVVVAYFGKRMITQLGLYPSKTPSIQMSVFLILLVTEVITFCGLIGFYRFFVN